MGLLSLEKYPAFVAFQIFDRCFYYYDDDDDDFFALNIIPYNKKRTQAINDSCNKDWLYIIPQSDDYVFPLDFFLLHL